MARPSGSKNEGYEGERRRLARQVLERLTEPDGPRASFRELARSCDVSPPTLRHYFDNHCGAIEAALEEAGRQGSQHLAMVSDADLGPVDEALGALLRLTIEGWRRFGVGEMLRAGLEVGLGDERLGPAYVEQLLEPLLQAFEDRLEHHRERGELRAELDPRYGALSLIAPIFVGLLHQRELGGLTCRPLALDDFTTTHLDAFLRAWRPSPNDDAPIDE